MLSSEAQQSLPQDAQVALQQVDNRKFLSATSPLPMKISLAHKKDSQIFFNFCSSRLVSRPADQTVPAPHRRLCLMCALVRDCDN